VRRLLAPLVLLALLLPAAGAQAKTPRAWLGASFAPAYIDGHANLGVELRRMRRAGVGSARFAVYWSRLQPQGPHSPVFKPLDRIVAAAAKARLPLLPVVLAAPRWAAATPHRALDVPRDPADYAAIMRALVKRYGPGGFYFRHHPRVPNLPVRTWQIWNEVSNPYYWSVGYASEYPRTLKAAYDAVKSVDPSATVVMAGLNTGGAGTSWDALDALYRQLDAQGLGRPFDEIAVHIYTKNVPDALKVVRKTRAVAARHGDAARPLRVTELAWPAAKGKLRDKHGHKRDFFAATTDKGMAKRLAKGVALLARQRIAQRISGVDWFQWASSYKGTDDAFTYSGLRHAAHKRLTDKPAMRAFKRVARRLRS
jgi:hypothetical protein